MVPPKNMESVRSSRPPWPGMTTPESLTPTPRLIRDSKRSPTTEKMPTRTPQASARVREISLTRSVQRSTQTSLGVEKHFQQ